MRIYAVTPIHVSADELTLRQQRYDQISPPGMTVELHDLGAEAPALLETPDDIRKSARLVTAALRAADGAGYDALLPDCVLDPGVAELRDQLATPLYGLLQLTIEHLAGQPFGAVTRTRAIADEITVRAEDYDQPLVATSVLDLGTGTADQTRWLAALGMAVNELVNAGAEIVINGCYAVELTNARSGRVPVVDPAVTALHRLAA